MPGDGLWSIGELAERAGVTVKTVRHYSDRGLLPEAGRSAGGHRRYGPGALDRLGLIRSLRALDLPVAEVGRVLEDGEALAEVVSGRLREVGERLAALRWREASLRLVRDSPEGERAERLRLLGAVAMPPGTGELVRFWRRVLPVRLPGPVVASVLDAVVPGPPAEPTPAQVLAFARLHALVSGPGQGPDQVRAARPLPDGEYRPVVLYEGLAEVYGAAWEAMRAGRGVAEAGVLDGFVAVYGRALGRRDTPAFRRRLTELLAAHEGPLLVRYWKLAAPLFGPDEPVLGLLHHELSTSLRARVGEPTV
ncbi:MULTISPECIES: MerR family transcriptional regulator [unclassified Streptomyces]|uniref:helix-turn-helix domain-containing protein n=1 Tax=unclassified Streptomyces TaxID=2593676 RepID=UPI0016607131|nr:MULTISPECIES: MerR family transcriptional regulator [unclassified Streptomyces]MBD0709038.1 MerR family transcriptional regulator [Streptomyces sp. CBMA291]MBD0715390.1 MerR family transcriptional regulator [Streptomyces sp. CBMA370]